MSSRTALMELIQNLQESSASIDPCRREIPGLQAIAEEVSKILWAARPGSQLAGELRNLWTAFPKAETALFVIQPYSSTAVKRQVAWLQLLVLSAQGYAKCQRRVIPAKLGPSLANLATVAKRAQRGLARYVGDRGARTAANELINALRRLGGMLPRGIELQGCHIIDNGRRISEQLTLTESRFMNLLIEAKEQEVTKGKFNDAKIAHPAKIKSRLVCKPTFKFLSQHIHAGLTGGYMLKQP